MLTKQRAEAIADTVCPDQRKAFMAFMRGDDVVSIAEHCFTGCKKCPEAMDLLAKECGGTFFPGMELKEDEPARGSNQG